MTRIVAGSAGGRTLKVPPSGTRPTTERVREALFSRLEHLGVVDGANVLDLYAGSGALGLEAASRGAAHVVLVEAASRAAGLIRDNARALGLAGACEVVTAKVETHLAGEGMPGYDLAFLDPPYDIPSEALDAALDALARPGVMAPDSVVVVERAKRDGGPTWPPSWVDEGDKTYGDTTLWYATANPTDSEIDGEEARP